MGRWLAEPDGHSALCLARGVALGGWFWVVHTRFAGPWWDDTAHWRGGRRSTISFVRAGLFATRRCQKHLWHGLLHAHAHRSHGAQQCQRVDHHLRRATAPLSRVGVRAGGQRFHRWPGGSVVARRAQGHWPQSRKNRWPWACLNPMAWCWCLLLLAWAQPSGCRMSGAAFKVWLGGAQWRTFRVPP